MNWINVSSTSILKFSWNKERNELYVVHTTSSQQYTYFNFSQYDYNNLLNIVRSGKSIGRYYHANIKMNPKHNINL